MKPSLTQGTTLNFGDVPTRRVQMEAGVPLATRDDYSSIDARVSDLEAIPQAISRAKLRFLA